MTSFYSKNKSKGVALAARLRELLVGGGSAFNGSGCKEETMFERLGKRACVVAFVLPAVVICVFALMFYPMARMELKDLPFALVTLDEGATLPIGELSVGDELSAALESGEGFSALGERMAALGGAEGEDAAASGGGAAAFEEDGGSSAAMADAISWTVLEGQQALEEALGSHDYYGIIVVPENFTLSQVGAHLDELKAAMASQMQQAASNPQAAAAQAEAIVQLQEQVEQAGSANLTVYLDYAKSPLVATQLQSALPGVFSQAGVSAKVEVLDDGGYEIESTSPMAPMISQQIAVLPCVIGSLIVAVVLSRVLNLRKAGSLVSAGKMAGVQLVLAAAAALVVALCAWCAVAVVSGMEMPLLESVGFLWVSVFCVTLVLLGCFDIALPLGVVVAVTLLALGNMLAVLPYEALPSFWQDFVFPWAPQRFVGEGLREVLYLGSGAFNSATFPLLVVAAVGVVLLVVRIAVAGKMADRS